VPASFVQSEVAGGFPARNLLQGPVYRVDRERSTPASSATLARDRQHCAPRGRFTATRRPPSPSELPTYPARAAPYDRPQARSAVHTAPHAPLPALDPRRQASSDHRVVQRLVHEIAPPQPSLPCICGFPSIPCLGTLANGGSSNPSPIFRSGEERRHSNLNSLQDIARAKGAGSQPTAST
jgi:hypothetical protein